jgi:hypothetical protein
MTTSNLKIFATNNKNQKQRRKLDGSRTRFSYKDCIVAIIAFANILSLGLFKYEISTYRYFHVVHDDLHRAA